MADRAVCDRPRPRSRMHEVEKPTESTTTRTTREEPGSCRNCGPCSGLPGACDLLRRARGLLRGGPPHAVRGSGGGFHTCTSAGSFPAVHPGAEDGRIRRAGQGAAPRAAPRAGGVPKEIPRTHWRRARDPLGQAGRLLRAGPPHTARSPGKGFHTCTSVRSFPLLRGGPAHVAGGVRRGFHTCTSVGSFPPVHPGAEDGRIRRAGQGAAPGAAPRAGGVPREIRRTRFGPGLTARRSAGRMAWARRLPSAAHGRLGLRS